MGLETGSFISDLVQTWPLGTDPVSQGDNHIQLIKKVLKSQFAGHGTGWDKAVLANPIEINMLYGIRTDISVQNQIDGIIANSGFPSGTCMIFYNQNPPPGWSLNIEVDDCMLRVVSGVNQQGGTFYGFHSPISFNWNHIHNVNGHSLIPSELPPHTHQMFVPATGSGPIGSGQNAASVGGSDDYLYTISPTSGVASAGKTGTGNDNLGGQPHGHTTDVSGGVWQPKYINVIKATKI